ncbi:hypothetical protein [Actibacterium sp. D379-3]
MVTYASAQQRRTEHRVCHAVLLVLLPLEILSGGVTTRESMPEALQYVMVAVPNTHFIALAQGV